MKSDDTLTVVIAVVVALAIASWLFSDTLTTHWIHTKSGAPAAPLIYSVPPMKR